MTLTLKDDVQLAALDARILLADVIVASVYAKYGLDCLITSGTEGTHMAGSKHSVESGGRAHDYKTFHVPAVRLVPLVVEISQALPGYDVLYEAPAKPADLPDRLYWKSDQPHLHVEFDPHTYTVR